MVKRIYCICVLAILLQLALNASISWGESLGPGGGDVRVGENIIRNPGFEEETDGFPTAWDINGLSGSVVCKVTKDKGLQGSKCLEISSSIPVETYVTQQVDADTDKYYRVMLNVVPMKIEKQFGAPHLVIYYGNSPKESTKKYYSAEMKDTEGYWTCVGFYIKTLKNIEEPLHIALSLGGGQGGKNSGIAWFDEISMQPVINPQNLKEFEKVAFTDTGIIPPAPALSSSGANGINSIVYYVFTGIFLSFLILTVSKLRKKYA